ncbi:MAG TPA: uroporphyrinogen decarboxylase [Acidimicrobiales bacterium]|nr:uroporphyrinogen decarboxylase [Acidimicrobiales bacterium]
MTRNSDVAARASGANASPAGVRPGTAATSETDGPDRYAAARRPGSDFLRACRGLDVERTPVWFMRQAGRSLPEYRSRRGEGSIFDAVRQPELAAELTLQPVRRYGVDAAILFSDIVVPAFATGFPLELVGGVGPVVAEPIRHASDLKRLRPFVPGDDAPYVAETVRILAGELDVPLIGFAGAPFTVASYLVEGGPSRDYAHAKALMHTDEATWFELLDRLAGWAVASLTAQVEAGAAAIQLFDSWAGVLSRSDYERFVLPASRRVLAELEPLGVPRIHFGVGTGELLDLMAAAGAEVVGVDWRVPLGAARRRLGTGVAVQGNLDPVHVLSGALVAEEEARRVLAEAGSLPGHVFNLGHGVLPGSDPGVLARVVELVHEETAAGQQDTGR